MSKSTKSMSVIFVLGAPLVMLACSMMFPSVTPEDVQTLRTICSELPVPASFHKIREHILEKPELVIYAAEYTSDESPEAVESAFKVPLTGDGWRLFERQDSGERVLDFKKGKYSIHIEYFYMPKGIAQKYLVNCGYNVAGK